MRIRRALLLSALLVLFAFAAGCGGDESKDSADGPKNVLRIAIGSEPPSLDPGLLTDVVSANIALNLMDPARATERRPRARGGARRELGDQ